MPTSTDYLRATLSAEHYAHYRALLQQEQRDSVARRKWRYIKTLNIRLLNRPGDPQISRWRQTAIDWLIRYGYADAEGRPL